MPWGASDGMRPKDSGIHRPMEAMGAGPCTSIGSASRISREDGADHASMNSRIQGTHSSAEG